MGSVFGEDVAVEQIVELEGQTKGTRREILQNELFTHDIQIHNNSKLAKSFINGKAAPLGYVAGKLRIENFLFSCGGFRVWNANKDAYNSKFEELVLSGKIWSWSEAAEK